MRTDMAYLGCFLAGLVAVVYTIISFVRINYSKPSKLQGRVNLGAAGVMLVLAGLLAEIVNSDVGYISLAIGAQYFGTTLVIISLTEVTAEYNQLAMPKLIRALLIGFAFLDGVMILVFQSFGGFLVNPVLVNNGYYDRQFIIA